ncbi:MFS transporter [Nocardia carnea]|uniref:MFS transporter n=1 Tax=Nocardia carnea TaxID=37328 RepID=UPI002458472D|nr:MFS transporter [Nocardia carnea]
MSRFARVFGALGGSRGSARPASREPSGRAGDRFGNAATPENSASPGYRPPGNAAAREAAAPSPGPAAARGTSGPRRGSRPAFTTADPSTPDFEAPGVTGVREGTPPNSGGRPWSAGARESAAPDDRRVFADPPWTGAGAGHPASGTGHPLPPGDHAARGRPGDPAPTKEYRGADLDPEHDDDGRRVPRKLTVTRVAAMRGKELTGKGIATFRRAAEADGADKSGLTALTYATMANFALDAAIAVALANTLFFASATAESKSKVALYLLITIAPFAIIAPLIGPALDRLQTGRRLALAASFAARAVLAVVLIFSMDSWVLYPLALCMMVLSKSFAVLKSAVTPRVLPPDIDLVRTNSRLTVFGLVGGTLGAGGIAGATAALTGSTGALILATAIAIGGAYLSWQIPRWVEITEGEVPATLGYHGDDPQTEILEPGRDSPVPPRKRRQPLGRAVVTGLWGNGSIRVLTGFLTFYIAFVAKATEHRPVQQAAMLGLVGAAAAVGNFAGNATGARLRLGRPSLIVVNCTLACTAAAAAALILDNLLGAALAALVAAAASALAKVSLDASIQDDLPPESIASGFGRSETVLQLSWVIGGAGGVLLPTDYWKGFAVVSAVLAAGLVQTVLSSRGHSLLPGLGGRRPLHAEQEIPHHDPPRGDTAR